MGKRKQLQARDGERLRFRAVFVRHGTKRGWHRPERTILLRDVTTLDNGQMVTTHLWFNLTKGFAALGELHEGDRVEFDARVTTYVKGYQGRRAEQRGEAWAAVDYKLNRPTKIARGTDGRTERN